MVGLLAATGKLIFTALVSNGAVMMKITSNTSITSISGIMLISAIGALSPFLLNPPNDMSGSLHGRRGREWCDRRKIIFKVRASGQKREQIVRERIELREFHAVPAYTRVVGEYRGNCHRETERGHDQ